ncbi:MAG: 3'-5' exonuclease domain-containing protein 2 [Muribaculaceae bacterium]|nr:3'-5' exonuclease domain-containing protein 2 [Muribaculaceae bacterium]
MPLVHFDGGIYVVDAMHMVKSAINVLRRYEAVGFDTETRPSFQKGRGHKLALIQLSTPNECFLFRVNKIGVPGALADYLADENCKKIGLSTPDDFNALHRVSNVKPAGFIELQQLVKTYGIEDMSLQKIYAIIFGKKISKNQRLTNWELPELTDAQKVYAAIDAWACLKIYDELTQGRFDGNKSPYKIIDDEEV